jgi:hypothetical protein
VQKAGAARRARFQQEVIRALGDPALWDIVLGQWQP